MARVIERVAGHYEVQQEELGKAYQWRPGSVVVECKCGERASLTSSTTACDECGSDHTSTVWEGLAVKRVGDKTLHPWRYDGPGDREDDGLPYYRDLWLNSVSVYRGTVKGGHQGDKYALKLRNAGDSEGLLRLHT